MGRKEEYEFTKIYERYLRHVSIAFSEGTYNFAKHHAKIVLDFLTKNNITDDEQVDKYVIEDYIVFEQKRGVCNATINKRIGTFRRALEHSESKAFEEVRKIKI